MVNYIGYYLLRLKPPFYNMNGIDAARSAALEYQRPSLSRSVLLVIKY